MRDVVERIRNLSMAVDMTGCSNESEQKVSDEITRLRAENERLLKENFSLSAWQCEFADGKTGLVAHEHGGTYCAMAKENERLREELDIWKSVFPDIAPQNVIPDRSLVEQENERLRAANRDVMLHWDVLKADYERLRAALKPILNYPNIREKIGNQLYDLGCAALDGQPAPGKEEA